MARFTSLCNIRFSSNVTEATDHYFEGLTEILDESLCYDKEMCTEYAYNELEMGLFGVQGMYPVNKKYGIKGYYMDFKGADSADTRKKIDYLKSIKWIDQFTKAVALKWTVLNQWDKHFYSITMMCETPGLSIRRCQHTVENVSFPERNFNAKFSESGELVMEDQVLGSKRMQALLIGVGLFISNFIYTFKLALELNLGISMIINALELLHIFIVELALLFFFYR